MPELVIDIHPDQTLLSVANISIVNAQTPEDAWAQLDLTKQEYIRVTVFAQTDPFFIGTEGILEFCRLCRQTTKKIIPVLPIDYASIMLAQHLNIPAVEIEATHPLFERGIARPHLLRKILQDLSIPAWVGGIFTAQEKETLYTWGCQTIVHYPDHQVSPS